VIGGAFKNRLSSSGFLQRKLDMYSRVNQCHDLCRSSDLYQCGHSAKEIPRGMIVLVIPSHKRSISDAGDTFTLFTKTSCNCSG
jgi:hypothetical protein